MNGFTRQEVLQLTGARSSDLSYWDRTGLITPTKIGNPQHPTVLYTPEQILQIKLIYALRERFSLQEIRGIIEFLSHKDLTQLAVNCELVLLDSKPYLISSPEQLGSCVLAMSKKSPLTVLNMGTVSGLLESVLKAGDAKILDFRKRIKWTILDISQKT